ncbi:MAG: choice-of-anchor J domain-containing protein, partial [Muribaculaceae bacterium]|nr:choice-of-anchor J domain-containing protein [Muribaculaceae bacterium]
VRISGPSGCYDGTAGSGDITYHLYANGKEVANGTRAYGSYSYTTVNVELPSEGSYCFAVSFSNEAGEGPRKYSSATYIGMDTPKAPASVSVSYADGKATVKWGAVSSGIHSGTIDRANLVYRVTRWPEGTVVSPADQKTTSFVDEIAMPEERTSYWYTVEAVTGDKVSPTAKSSSFDLGPIVPAYSTDFATAADFIGYTSLSPDGKLWSHDTYDKCAKVATSAKPADNWLILPVMRLTGGNSYEFTMSAHAYSSSYTENFEVKYGTEPTAEAMTATAIEATSVSGSTPTSFSGNITVDEDGLYYIGIHATTPSNGGYLYVDAIAVASGISDRAPAAVSDVSISAAENGAHTVTANFTTPGTTIGGAQLEAITRIELLCDGEVVNSISENIATGTAMSISDTNAPAGKHTYSVICYNRYGTGSEVKAEVFVGFAAPVATDLVTMTEPSQGHVVASWSPVTKDVDGRTLGEGDVKYNVYEYLAGDLYPVATGIEGTSCEYDAFAEFPGFDDQRFVQTIVEAVTEGGTSKRIPSAMTPVGKPYQAPWSESFANCSVNSIFANEKIKGDDVWQMVAADDFGTSPADNDGGMMYFEAYGRGSCGLVTGKIDLGDIIAPAFIFQVFNYLSSSPNENVVAVDINAGDGYVNAFTSTVMECGTPGQWNKVTVPLDEYAGQTVQIRISATNNTFGFTHIDDLRVTSVATHNLAVSAMSAPKSVARNTDFNISVDVENLGLENAIGYKLNLLRNDEFAGTLNGKALEPEAKATFTFTDNVDVLAAEELVYTVEIEYGPDMFAGDNTQSVIVMARTSALPAVADLDGKAENGGVRLTWSEPAKLTIGAPLTETFDAPSLSWATQVPDWTFHDVDGGTMGGIGNKQLPVSGRQSFFVFDNTLPALQAGNVSAFNAHSGNQYLCSMYAKKGSSFIQSDDWAVSPELSGEPQMISLYATSFPSDPDQPQYLETFQLLSSTTGNEPADFTLIEEFANIPAQWRQYSAYLP